MPGRQGRCAHAVRQKGRGKRSLPHRSPSRFVLCPKGLVRAAAGAKSEERGTHRGSKPLQLAHQIKGGLKGFGAGLPLCRTDLVAMLGDKLRRLQ